MSLRLNIAKVIYEDEKVSPETRIECLYQLKEFTDQELHEILEYGIVNEGIGKLVIYGYTAVLGAEAISILKHIFIECKYNCKRAYKYHKDKKRMADCIELCSKKVNAKLQAQYAKKFREKYHKNPKDFNPEMGKEY